MFRLEKDAMEDKVQATVVEIEVSRATEFIELIHQTVVMMQALRASWMSSIEETKLVRTENEVPTHEINRTRGTPLSVN